MTAHTKSHKDASQKLITTSTVGMSYGTWLQERRKGIGGSEAAGLVPGLESYATPYSIWADKTGRINATPDNEAMRQGRDLEQYVADRWMDATGKKCRKRNEIIRNPKYPFAHANVDRWVIGENAGLECKTVNALQESYFTDEFPNRYYGQCVHYMAVTGADRWYLSVVILGRGYKHYVLERDQGEIDALMSIEKDFWENYVETDTAPPPDGEAATSEAINSIYSDGGDNDEMVDLFGESSDIERYLYINKEIKELKNEQEEIKQRLKTKIGDAHGGTVDQYRVTWSKQCRPRFNDKQFAKDHPDIDLDDYYSKSTSRIMKVKEVRR